MIATLVLVIMVEVVKYVRRRGFAILTGSDRKSSKVSVKATADRPRRFGYKMAWLAVRAEDPVAVSDALNLEDVQLCNWSSGITIAYRADGRGFVSPSVAGWVFVVCGHLPELGHPPDNENWMQMMNRLAAQFDDVQYFGTHRIVGYQAWARYVGGRHVRSFCYLGESGETKVNEGDPTAGELELDFRFFDEQCPEAKQDEYWEREDLTYPEEEDVMHVAGKWSLNPQMLEEMDTQPGIGQLGCLELKTAP